MVRPREAHETIDVSASIDWAYAAWIEFTKIPLNDVDTGLTEATFRGTAGVLGSGEEFDVEITEHEPNQLIAWHAKGEGDVSGVVRFLEISPAETRVDVTLVREIPEAGPRADPGPMLREALVCFKRQAESASPEDFTQTTPAHSGDAPRTPAGASVAASLESERSPEHRDAVTDDIARAAGVDERELRRRGLRPPTQP